MALKIEVFGMPQGNKIDMNVAQKAVAFKNNKGQFFNSKNTIFLT